MGAKVAFAVLVIYVAVFVAKLQSKRKPMIPTQPRGALPVQINRADFAGTQFPWCVIVFSSATCGTCADVVAKAKVLECVDVAVVEVEYAENRDIHERYEIDAVPGTIIVDENGVVRASFRGPVTATDLWAAVAECRHPGSSPEPELGS